MLTELIERYPSLKECAGAMQDTVTLLIDAYSRGNKLLACGNGGSAADCEHITGELMKGFMKTRPVPPEDEQRFAAFGPEGEYLVKHLQKPLPALSLVSSVSLSTAFSNDVAADLVFAQQVYGLGNPGDVLLAISTSGTSQNILYAVIAARAMGLHTVGLTGSGGGRLGELCDICINPSSELTPDIQELHLPIYHYICKAVEEHFFGT
jgi:D-sedoheptulose 7-phosphate isomerase